MPWYLNVSSFKKGKKKKKEQSKLPVRSVLFWKVLKKCGFGNLVFNVSLHSIKQILLYDFLL